MIRRQPMRHARATVMGQHAEALEAVVLHRGERIERHFPLAVDEVICVGRRAARVAIATQIHRNHGEPLGQRRRRFGPRQLEHPVKGVRHGALRRALQGLVHGGFFDVSLTFP